MKHQIHTGPQEGKFQTSHREKRYLLAKRVQTGPKGGKFQEYRDSRGRKRERYLLS